MGPLAILRRSFADASQKGRADVTGVLSRLPTRTGTLSAVALLLLLVPAAAQTPSPSPTPPPGPVYWDADASSTLSVGDLVVSGGGAGSQLATNPGTEIVWISGQPPPLVAIDAGGDGNFSGSDSLFLDVDLDGRHTAGDVRVQAPNYGGLLPAKNATGLPYSVSLVGLPRYAIYADVNSNALFDAGDYAYWAKESAQLSPGDVRATPTSGHAVGTTVFVADSDLVAYGDVVALVPGQLGILASAVPDLLVQSLGTEISADQQTLVVSVTAVNIGGAVAESASLTVFAGASAAEADSVFQLGPGKTFSSQRAFPMSSFEPGSTIPVSAIIQPDPGTLDRDLENNAANSSVVAPSPSPSPTPATTPPASPSISSPPPTGGTDVIQPQQTDVPSAGAGTSWAPKAATAGAGGITMGFVGAKAARVWKHRRLQGDAEDRTPGECSGRKWRCVRETEKEFELRSVTRLSVTPQRRGAREPDDAIDLSGTTLDKLNGAIKARRKAAKRAEIEEQLDAVARDVAASARTLVEETQEPQDVVLSAKLEGSRIGTTFTLQRCFPVLGWRDIESWTATLKDAPKHVVARLSEVPAGPEGAAATRPDAWIGPLRTFLERAKPPIGFSPKAETSHARGRLL